MMTVRPRPSTARTRPDRHARGFTLIELMIAIVVSSIVILGVFAFSTIQKATVGIHARNIKIQQSLEGAMWTIGQDVRAAGSGFARVCSELRVWDAGQSMFVNPGGMTDAASAAVDPVTGEAYWVLRDGFQAHWKSTDTSGDTFGTLGANTASPSWAASSASQGSAADSFDVIRSTGTYGAMAGVFTQRGLPTGGVFPLQSTYAFSDEGEVRQLFPPGSFFLVTFEPTHVSVNQRQCALLQVTGDVTENAAGTDWDVPVAFPTSGFNNLGAFADPTTYLYSPTDGGWDPGADDWGNDNVVIPLGHLRWSRYEIDYTVPEIPYLVRYEFIDAQEGEEVSGLATTYPGCDGTTCPLPQLHLPSNADAPPRATAVAPVIEDMQVAVGCDGRAAGDSTMDIPDPTTGFLDPGPFSGPNTGNADNVINEGDPGTTDRETDEWLGNARGDSWGPDCVEGGVGQVDDATWATLEAGRYPSLALFRMSPQTIRITLVGTSEAEAGPGGLANVLLPVVEDRGPIDQPAGGGAGPREHFTLTERFTPKNARWRDARIP